MSGRLEVEGLAAFYGQAKILHEVGLTLPAGTITTLLGANGAGKTTLLRAICNTVHNVGAMRLDGRSIAGLPTEQIVRLGVAHVPEGRGTFTAMSVDENLRIAAYARRDRAGVLRDRDMVLDYFPRLRQRLGQQAGNLSGGEQQMLALARGLMLSPRLMLLDEPSFGLAPMIVAEVAHILRRINGEQGMTMLLVEQNAALAFELAQQAYVLETGRVVMSGPVADVRTDERVRMAYLGG